MTAGERLQQISWSSGITAGAMMLLIGSGATAGEILRDYSKLPTATAAVHLLTNVSKAADYEDRKKKKYIVKIGGNLLVFSNEADAIGAIQAKEASSSQIKKQYPAKKAKKQDKVVEIKQEKQVLPDYQVNLAEIAALAERQAAYAQYQAFIQQMQYEALLNAYENWLAIEDEEEVERLEEFISEEGAWALEDEGDWYLDETEVWVWGPLLVIDEDGNERIIIADDDGNVLDFKE